MLCFEHIQVREWLGLIVEQTLADSTHSLADVGIASDHDRDLMGAFVAHLLQKIQAVPIGKPLVHQNQVVVVRAKLSPSRCGIHRDVQTFGTLPEQALEKAHRVAVVVDQKYFCRHVVSPALPGVPGSHNARFAPPSGLFSAWISPSWIMAT
jgi:hypothetical protein